MKRIVIKRNSDKTRLFFRSTAQIGLLLVCIGLTNNLLAQQQGGSIVLNQLMPSTAVTVVATEQVKLTPGFHAIGSSGNFNAKIGPSNNIYPLIPIDQHNSTVVIPTSPSSDQNYIKTSTCLLPVADGPTLNFIQYFDGLGRPSQSVQRGITPTGADLVSLIRYDGVGREWKKYLPTGISSNYGQYVDTNTIVNTAQGLYDDIRPFAETHYEPSPLNRADKQYGAGNEWFTNNKKTTIEYQTNASDVAYYYVDNNQLKRDAQYTAGALYVTRVSDEDENPAYEFKDRLGHVILKRSINDGQNINTYYVYNDLGQVSYVLPPIAADSLPASEQINDDNGVIKRYAYLYKYDKRGNNIEKRLPGCEPIYMVYDRADRLILSQDGNQRQKSQAEKKQWTVTKYDGLGRIIMTGTTYIDSTKTYTDLYDEYASQLITEVITSGTYSNEFFPTASPLTVNYYDNYNFIPSGNNLVYDTRQEQNGYTAQWPNATGLLTGTQTCILGGAGSPSNLATAIYYDDKGRVVQTRGTNYMGGYDIIYNAYNFTGQVVKTLKENSISTTLSTPLTELYAYTYDNALRLLTTTYSLNGADQVTLASNTYDELGRLTEKKRHQGGDTEQYEYNIRNWTTRIQSGTFIENLYYNAVPQGILNTPCFNGNITFSTWTYHGGTNKYGYSYDNLNRLTATTSYDSYNIPNPWNTESFGYDKMGNITTLGRIGTSSPIDELTLHYTGNQLKKVDDLYRSRNQYYMKEYNNSADLPIEFTYDKNGNMLSDLDRNITTIQYNILNLPEVVLFGNGNQIRNVYDAGGQKLRSDYYTRLSSATAPITANQPVYSPTDYDYTGTAYIGNAEYQINKNVSPGGSGYVDNFTLLRLHNSEGYVANPGGYVQFYSYFRKDHLGNVREVWTPAFMMGNIPVAARTSQVTQYYASGLPWATTPDDFPDAQPYKYNGKEFVEMHGYDSYDYGARVRMGALPIFTGVDPLAEIYYSISPYAYCMGNPIKYVDNNGLWPTKKIVDNGRTGSPFGPRNHPIDGKPAFHSGQDFPAPIGSDIHAAADGIVKIATYQLNPNTGRGWGWYMDILHIDGTVTKYSHLKQGSFRFKAGDMVKNGQVIALSGASGGVTGPHLDLEIIRNGKPINPLTIEDLQKFLNDEEFDNEDNPFELPEQEVKAKNPNPEKTLEQRLNDLEWSSVRSNQNGNTGRYNIPNRSSDQNYSDEFLKWYYKGDPNNDSNNK